jgi:alpha-glucosidase
LKKHGFPLALLVPLFTFLFAVPAFAEWQPVGSMVARPPEGNQISFHNRQAIVTISVLATDLVRVRMSPGDTPGQDYSWAVIKTDWPKTPVEFSGNKQLRIIKTPAMEVRVQLSPFQLAFYGVDGRLISKDVREMAWDGEHVRCWKIMPPDEHYFGLGEKAGPLDKRGHSYVMWNTDPSGYDALTDPMYQTIPFFIGVREGKVFGIFFDNTHRSSFDMGTESPDYYSFGADGGEMNYYFFSGPDPQQVLRRFTELVGRTPLPPLWSLGYIQSSVIYYPESVVRFEGENFRHRHIPCDALFLDTMHMDGNRVFTWDKSRFPDPPRMLTDLRKEGFRVIAITDPGVKVDDNYWVYKQGLEGDHFLKKKDGKLYVGTIWPGDAAFPDFTSEKTRAWWASLFEGLLKDGIAGFLTDMNEPTVDDVPLEKGWKPRALDPDVVHYDHGLQSPDAKNHNIYGMLMSSATRDGLLRFHPNERPFVITRATFAGGQRFAAQWTGDNLATWEDLRASLRIVLSMGLSGLPFVGSDTGGFVGLPGPELYTRWLEAAVFHPYFWTHSGSLEYTVDPWSFGGDLAEVNRRTIELRYRLLPYLYNAFYEATQTGLPIMRALVLSFPDDTRVMDLTPDSRTNEFMTGDDLLVAPVVKAGETKRNVYLPKGTWSDFWTDKRYTGPTNITVDAPLAHIPIFVRGGAIVPLRQVVQYVEQEPINPLTFEIYPEGESSRTYYEDDGLTLNYQQGSFLIQKVSVADQGEEISLRISPRQGSYVPADRSLILKVHALQRAPQVVQVGGRALDVAPTTDALSRLTEGTAYDGDARVLWIKIPDQSGGITACVRKIGPG